MRLPDRRLVRLLVARGTLLWLLAHLIVLGAFAMGSQSFWQPARLHLSPVQAFWSLVFCGVLAWLDLRRRRELVLLANLGIALPTVLAASLVPGVVGEVALFMFVPS